MNPHLSFGCCSSDGRTDTTWRYIFYILAPKIHGIMCLVYLTPRPLSILSLSSRTGRRDTRKHTPPPSIGFMNSLSQLCQATLIVLGINMRIYFTWFWSWSRMHYVSTEGSEFHQICLLTKEHHVVGCMFRKSYLSTPQALWFYHPPQTMKMPALIPLCSCLETSGLRFYYLCPSSKRI